MKLIKVFTWAMWSLVFNLTALPSLAADYPAPKEGSWVVRDFRFHTGVNGRPSRATQGHPLRASAVR